MWTGNAVFVSKFLLCKGFPRSTLERGNSSTTLRQMFTKISKQCLLIKCVINEVLGYTCASNPENLKKKEEKETHTFVQTARSVPIFHVSHSSVG